MRTVDVQRRVEVQVYTSLRCPGLVHRAIRKTNGILASIFAGFILKNLELARNLKRNVKSVESSRTY